jgi:ATP-dependent DNA helicase RecQ
MPAQKSKAGPGRDGVSAQARHILREQFGIRTLRPGQAEVMASVLRGNDTIAVMPTASGKSLCYQVPALCLPGLTVVVSPLIALMKDQDEKLAELGVDAAVFNSATPEAEQTRYRRGTARHRHPILLATPERLSDREFVQWLQRQSVSLFVVDEAHCISQWGHDFRPAYLDIPGVVHALGAPPVLAMTATATDEVVQDIAASLNLRAACVIKVGVYRDNLHYEVRQVAGEESKQAAVLELVAGTPGSAIVYTATVKEAEALYEMLKEAGENVGLYHGRLPSRRRTQAQDGFMDGSVRVMVATDAFGMGIDKPDVRLVVHAQLPGSLDAYYQESGRAGRDGKAARCVLIHEEKDKRIQQFFLANRYPSEEMLQRLVRTVATAPAPLTFAALRDAMPDTGLRKLQVALKLLADAGIVARHADGAASPAQGDTISMVAPSDATKDQAQRVAQAARAYRERAEGDRQTLEAMVAYARSGRCRWRMLLDHFGETPPWERCDTCDSCKLVQAAESAVQAGDLPENEQPQRSQALLHVGDGVRVRRYGAGVVEAVTRERVDIRFPNGDLRRFLPGYVRRLKQKPPLPPGTEAQARPAPTCLKTSSIAGSR